MKLLYMWIENYENRINNQEISISAAYQICYTKETDTLHISKNEHYIDKFYGENILDIAAIVGENGAGKTTLARCMYSLCQGIHPVNEQYSDYMPKHIIAYEVGGAEGSNEIFISYYLLDDIKIESSNEIEIVSVNSYKVQGEPFIQACQQHDMTTVYFTNSFEINHVMPNQGASEFTEGTKHKSLFFSPMVSFNNAFKSLKERYGAEKKTSYLQLDVIRQYAEKMCFDLKTPYASDKTYNFLTAVRHCPGAIVRILPVMQDFLLGITEFGEYIKFEEKYIGLSWFDQTVYFIRKNIYEHIANKFKRNHWEQIYVNILCEIVLYLNVFNGDYKNVEFSKIDENYDKIDSVEAFETVLEQIPNNDKNKAEIDLIRRIKNIDAVDMSIMDALIEIDKTQGKILSSTLWYRQILNFCRNYNEVKDINIAKTIGYGHISLIDLILTSFDDAESIYGRMISIIPNPMSSGELALINIFASLYTAMKMDTSKSLLLIIDEIDAFLHPRWQQMILTHITRWINESNQFDNKKIQLVIATHSPIILSDIPSDKIIYLEKLCNVLSRDNLTLGGNINTLFYDSFFMDQGSIGELAKVKIQHAIDVLNKPSATENEMKEVLYVIDNIGERFIREKLQSHPIYVVAQQKRQEI